MKRFCHFCNKEHDLPALGQSNDLWYWQQNNTKLGGTLVCKQKKRFQSRKWELNNPEQTKAKHKKFRNKRRSTPKGKLRHSFSSLMSYRLASKSKKSTFSEVSYSLEELMSHLELLFKPGMTWDNYGKWEVDHIKPDCQFNYQSTKDQSFKECWALSNLQPMWSIDNKIKNGR